MALSCELHTAAIYDRGGNRKIGDLSPLFRVKWGRVRDDISNGQVFIHTVSPECAEVLGMSDAGRHELVIFRGSQRVWEGPITRIAFMGNSVEIIARDVMHYANRTAMHSEYDNRFPNMSTVLDRIKRVFDAELARKEALDPSANILSHVQYIYADATTNDARTAAWTVPYEMSVFEHVDTYAARGGIDYTVVGRSILLFDVNRRIGQTAMVTSDDFIGDPIITQYGMELATRVIMTDGKGNFGAAGGTDPHYGEWEVLHQAYDENAAGTDANDIPTVAEMQSQAERSLPQGLRPPLVLRIPDNTRVNPDGVLTISDLVPGTWIPLSFKVPGREVSQMQKLDSMSVEETGAGETILVTLSPAKSDQVFNDPEA